MKELSEEAEAEIANLKKTYENSLEFELDLGTGEPKNLLVAIDEKSTGNLVSAMKKYKKALEHYNKGILYCPQDTVSYFLEYYMENIENINSAPANQSTEHTHNSLLVSFRAPTNHNEVRMRR
ncbi:hypothetical protein JTB14_021035 [Gonioctena quinquepunctata]|nr:hypothetical protein JTB14_021035 [Gonioctena quinquepunctata]